MAISPPQASRSGEVTLGDVLVDSGQLLLRLFAYSCQLGAIGECAALEV
jgi:hypothetical protein